MILEAIFNLIKGIVLLIINLFPTLPDMAFLSQSIEPLITVLASVDSFVSVQLAAWCFVTSVVFTNIDFIWSIIIWVIRKIPGVS